MSNFFQDVRYALRMLAKNPAFAAVAVFTLALGIGANTAIFSVVNSVLLRPLPYDHSDQLVHLAERHPTYEVMSISYPDFLDWRAQNRVFESFGVFRYADYNLTGRGEPEQLHARQASAGLFAALRVHASIGRLFTENDDHPGAAPVVVLSHSLWQRRFDGDPNILNQAVTLSDKLYAVIGVLPKEFRFSDQSADHAELWAPVGQLADQPFLRQRDNHPGLRGIARLKPGVSVEQARTEINAIAERLEQQYPDTNKKVRAGIVPLLELEVRNVSRAMWILLGAVGLVLLIACANVANLMLARAAARRREMAVRMALGASRSRVARQLLTESLLLAIAGGALGLLLAQWGLDSLIAISAGSIPRAAEINLDKLVLIFTAVVSMLTGIFFGLAPALQLSRPTVQEALKETGRNAAGTRHRLRQFLVVSEVALTLVLLVGAGLLIRSFYRLQQVNPGFVDEHVLNFRISLPQQKYPQEQQWINFYQQALEKLRAVPGVKEVSITSRVPMGFNDWQSGFQVVGKPEPLPGQGPSMEVTLAAPNYFRVMGIPLKRGRFFDEQDNRAWVSQEKLRGLEMFERLRAGLRSMIIDEEFARRHWPGEDPIGKQIRWAGKDTPPITVVGVVGSVKLYRPDETGAFVQGYFPFFELPQNDMAIVLKTSLDPEHVIASARKEILALDPGQPIFEAKTLTQLREESIAPERWNLMLLGLFSVVAMTLALVGIYGVMSYTVTQLTREIGVRMALGAQTSHVLRLVVGQAMKLTFVGLALGLLTAMALARLMSSLLFQVSTSDPLTFSIVPALLALVALLACWIPARRAARVDPMEALRYE